MRPHGASHHPTTHHPVPVVVLEVQRDHVHRRRSASNDRPRADANLTHANVYRRHRVRRRRSDERRGRRSSKCRRALSSSLLDRFCRFRFENRPRIDEGGAVLVSARWIVVFLESARAMKAPSLGKNRRTTLVEMSSRALIISFR